jgi:hypothetical protein
VTVAYGTADDSAAAGSDYVARSGTLTFLAGATTQTIAITVNGDVLVEGDERFLIHLVTPTNAVIDDGQGEGFILNDDEESGMTSSGSSGIGGSQLRHSSGGSRMSALVVPPGGQYDERYSVRQPLIDLILASRDNAASRDAVFEQLGANDSRWRPSARRTRLR